MQPYSKLRLLKIEHSKIIIALFNTNVVAPALFISQLYCAGAFKENARIINISSPAATNIHQGLSAYSMSKSALNIFTEYAKKELFPQGNTLISWFNPGEVETSTPSNKFFRMI